MHLEAERDGGRIANAIIIPMIVVVLLGVVGAFGLLLWSAELSNTSSQQSKIQLISNTLSVLRTENARRQQETAVSDLMLDEINRRPLDTPWLLDRLGAWNNERNGFHRSLVIGPDLSTLLEYDADGIEHFATPHLRDQISGSVARVRARFITQLRKGGGAFAAPDYVSGYNTRFIFDTGFAEMGGEVYLYSAAPFMPSSNPQLVTSRIPPVLISFRRIDAAMQDLLQRLGRLQELRLTLRRSADEGYSALPIRSVAGREIAYLEWPADAPGTAFLRRLTPILLILLLAIIGLTVGVVDFARQNTRRLSRSKAQALYNSRHDSLSGLPNREHFFEKLSNALEHQTETSGDTAVVYLDLDHFKKINDTMGHASGDEVIRSVAQRVDSALPGRAVLARISGDEFAMFVPGCAGRAKVEDILKRIQAALARPITVGNTELFASFSIGIAMSPEDGRDPGDLMRKADIALYDAKAAGRACWSFFAPSMQEDLLLRDRLSRELRQAILENQLSIAYQPQSCRDGATVVGVEALARWDHPELGSISPARFIPLAEETGLINALGLWILRRACKDACGWENLIVSVNVSPTQFKAPGFVCDVMKVLAETGLPPARLELEVTESVLLSNEATTLAAMHRLQGEGIKIALDDFGAGYSSLSYLRRFSFNSLKIDRDFLSAVTDSTEAQAVLKTIISLGKALGMDVVGEGVEDADQLAFLARNGCDRMQGYFISQPLPLDALNEFLADRVMERVCREAAHALPAPGRSSRIA